MNSKQEETCAHELCDCPVQPGKKYCSQLCEQQEKAEPGNAASCPCGHLACGAGRENEKEHAEYA
jgi:hypothetical protein